jgi:phenylalanyl-tRNA synthetase beta chain
MNISYRWLKDLIPGLSASLEEVSELLAMRGAPIEDTETLSRGLEGIVVGRVEAVVPHPHADRLTVCRVDGGGGLVDVVCGAPNVRAGACYPFAPVGVTLPGGLEIREADIRGVHSVGMLCSERELGLGPDHTGIMELTGDLRTGQELTEALRLDDVLLDVEVTPNRPDLLSHVGIAREVAPGGSSGVAPPDIPGSPGFQTELRVGEREVEWDGVRIRIDDPDLCHRYLGAVVRGVSVGPSPEWLASRLRAVGARPINNVVDATNYVLFELGQPLHAFDLSRLRDSTVVVRRARPEEPLRTLDGEDRTLSDSVLAICDSSDAIAIAGVMGGEHSEVSHDSRDLLLECALFEPKSIRTTRKALGMSTDASYRFERGVDPEGMEQALRRAVEIILATAGGEADPVVLDVCPRPWEGLTVPLRPSRVEHLLGVPFEREDLRAVLEPLGFSLSDREDGAFDVSVPGYRSYDVVREVDLIEEVARVHGYENFPDSLRAFRPGTVPDDPMLQLQDQLRDFLVAMGFFEAQSPAFAPESEGTVRIQNPISIEEAFLRRSLLPGVLRRVEFNLSRGARDIRLFETGSVFDSLSREERPLEEMRLAAVMTGRRTPLHWSEEGRDFEIWDLKGTLLAVLERSRIEGELVPEAPDEERLDPKRAFTVRGADGTLLGVAGRVRPEAVDAPAWAADLWALEVTLPDPPPPPAPILYTPPPVVPAVERDLALIIPMTLPVARVTDLVQSAAGTLAERVEIFDLYEGMGIPAGTRSVAYRLRFRAPDRTLKDEEVERSVADVLRILKQELGVVPRGA